MLFSCTSEILADENLEDVRVKLEIPTLCNVKASKDYTKTRHVKLLPILRVVFRI